MSCSRIVRAGLAAMALVLGSVSAHALEIETALGPVEVGVSPKTIAVFDIPAVDTLTVLGVPIAGIPDNLYLPELAPLAARAEVVGSLFEPDLEALGALAPDLVIVGGRSSPKLNSVARVATAIDMTIGGVDLIRDARQRAFTYGALFGKEAEARGAIASLDEAVARVRSVAGTRGRALIVMTSGPKISVFGEGSRFGWIHRDLGIASAIADREAAIHGDAVSFEFIREVDPDWLIVIDRSSAIGSGEAGARATLDNELVASTTAWTKGQVVFLPSADLYIAAGGIAATLRVIETIEAAFSRGP